MFTGFISTSLLMLLAFPSIANSFLRILLINLGVSAFVAGGVLDAYTLDLLETKDNREKYYGRIRLWTAVSWGLGNMLMGFVTDRTNNFTFNFSLFGGMSTLSLFMTYMFIPSQRKQVASKSHDDDGLGEEKKCNEEGGGEENDAREKMALREALLSSSTEEEIPIAPPSRSDLWRALREPAFVFFLIELGVMGAAVGVVERLLFIYLQNEMHANTFLCGLSVGVTVLLELPLFHYAGKLHSTLGHDGMMLTGMAAYVVRVLGYTFLTVSSRYCILALETLHGVTFALIWCASVEYAKHRSPRGWTSTIQSIVYTAYGCVGAGTGSAIGGYVMDRYGGKCLYRGAASLVSVVFVVHALVSVFSRTSSRRRTGGGGVVSDGA